MQAQRNGSGMNFPEMLFSYQTNCVPNKTLKQLLLLQKLPFPFEFSQFFQVHAGNCKPDFHFHPGFPNQLRISKSMIFLWHFQRFVLSFLFSTDINLSFLVSGGYLSIAPCTVPICAGSQPSHGLCSGCIAPGMDSLRIPFHSFYILYIRPDWLYCKSALNWNMDSPVHFIQKNPALMCRIQTVKKVSISWLFLI